MTSKQNILQLLEAKCKKHDSRWTSSNDPDEILKGKNNFDDIQRLCNEAKKAGLLAEAYAIVSKYIKT